MIGGSKHGLRYWLDVAGFLGILFATAVIAMWWTENAPTRIEERTLLTPQVRQGGELQLRVHVFRDRHCDAIITRILEDAQGYELARQVGDYAAQQVGEVTRVARIAIPSSFPPGPAIYLARVEWACNPLQRTLAFTRPIVEYPPIKFEVIP